VSFSGRDEGDVAFIPFWWLNNAGQRLGVSSRTEISRPVRVPDAPYHRQIRSVTATVSVRP
jgi:hypothetical protein